MRTNSIPLLPSHTNVCTLCTYVCFCIRMWRIKETTKFKYKKSLKLVKIFKFRSSILSSSLVCQGPRSFWDNYTLTKKTCISSCHLAWVPVGSVRRRDVPTIPASLGASEAGPKNSVRRILPAFGGSMDLLWSQKPTLWKLTLILCLFSISFSYCSL